MSSGSLSASVRSAATKSVARPSLRTAAARARSPCSRTATARRTPARAHRERAVPQSPSHPSPARPPCLTPPRLACSETCSRRPLKRAKCRPENGFRRQIAHTPMMTFRANRPLARSARYPMKYMPRLRMIGAGPGDVRRAEQRDDRRVEGRREMAGAGVGRDHERRPAHAGLGEPDPSG